jgi:diguanylate cyclase (GGDEF)-like protein/PAS domain S-box-containing protein
MRLASPVPTSTPGDNATPAAASPAVAGLRQLAWLASLAIAVSLAMAVVLLVFMAQAQDRAALAASNKHFTELQSLQGRQLGRHVLDYSSWDESISQLVQRTDVAWWEANAGTNAIEVFQLSHSLYIDPQNRLRLHTQAGSTRQNPPDGWLTPSLRALLAEARQSRPGPDDAPVTGIVDFAGELHLMAAAVIRPLHTTAPDPEPRGILLFARNLATDALREAGEIMAQPELRLLATGEEPAGLKASGAAVMPVVLANGETRGSMTWRPPTPGRALTAQLVPVMGAAFLLVAVVVLAAVRRSRLLAEQIERDARAREDLARRDELILQAVGEGIFGVDGQGQVVFANPAALKQLRLRAEEFIGRDPNTLLLERRAASGPVRLQDGPASSEHSRFLRGDGSSFSVEYVVTPLRPQDPSAGAVVVFRDITERRQMEENIRYRANFDALTGLANRQMFVERLAEALHPVHGSPQAGALLFIDLDHFKEVNDSLGHRAGDLLLQQAAQRLSEHVRDVDVVGRLGGDEFVVLLSGLSGPDSGAQAATQAATHVANKLVQALHQPFDLNPDGPASVAATTPTPAATATTATVGASIGIALFPQDGSDTDTLLQHADLAMYRAKQQGRGGYAFYRPVP